MTQQHLKILATADHQSAQDDPRIVHLANDADPFTLKDRLADIDRIDLDLSLIHI